MRRLLLAIGFALLTCGIALAQVGQIQWPPVQPASPPLALGAHQHANTGGGVTTLSVTLTTAASSGVLIAAVVNTMPANTDTISCASTTLGSWTQIAVQQRGTTAEWEYIFAHSFTSHLTSEVVTITGNVAMDFTTLDGFEIENAATASYQDPATAVVSATAPFNITTTHAKDFIFAGFTQDSVASPTAGSGWTLISGANFALVEYQIVNATNTYSATQSNNSDVVAAAGDGIKGIP